MDFITSTPEAAATPTLLFRVGASLYGCDVTIAREIIPLRPATRLPGAPRFVRGLINVRGTIVTVLDIGARLDATRAPARTGSILLVRHRERLVGLIVDGVSDVRVLDAADPSAEPIAGAAAGGIVKGVATVDHAAVVLLDVDALIKQVLLS